MEELQQLLASWNGRVPASAVADRYTAVRAENIRETVRLLDESDPESADTVRWLTWWYVHQSQQVAFRETVLGEKLTEVAENRQLLLDLWQYATGEAWGEMSAERAASESDTLGDLYARMSAAIGKGVRNG